MITSGGVPVSNETGGWQIQPLPCDLPEQGIAPPVASQLGLVPVTGQVNTITEVIAIASTGPGTLAVAGSSSDTGATYQSAHEAALQVATYTLSDDRTKVLYEQQVAMAIVRDRGNWLEHKANRQALIDAINALD